jgi:uncharacterized phage protein (TIGR01671 family)
MSKREIRFRAWSFTQHRMLDRVLAGPGDPCSLVWIEERKDWFNFDAVSGMIMQFTGLKDKNGKEVYEGDIIRATLVETGELKQVVEKVSYTEQYAGYTPFGHLMPFDEGRWIDCLSDSFEVIGNIYENPELLNR